MYSGDQEKEGIKSDACASGFTNNTLRYHIAECEREVCLKNKS
jgi:hypothetical protein